MTWNQGVIVAGLAMSIPGILFGPPLFGIMLDERLGTSPWFTLGLLVTGFAATVVDIIFILKRIKLME